MTFEVEPLAFSQHLNEEIEQFAAVGKTGFFALNMDTLSKIQDISLRIDQLETTGEWLARALVHVDSSGSQAGSMIMALAEDIRERVL